MGDSFECDTVYSSKCQALIGISFSKVIEKIYEAVDRAKNGL